MKKLFLLLLSCFVIFVACDSDDPDPTPPPPPPPTGKPDPSTNNTVLVYLAIDNDFSVQTDYKDKIEAMRSSWRSSLDGNLIVYCDAGIDKPVLVHIYQSDEGYNYADTVKVYDLSHNSASTSVLASVLNEVKTGWPADKYGMVFLSHASGWLPQGTLLTPRSIGSDWNDRTDRWANEMELADFAAKLPYELEYIIFDACFMGAVEVAYELKDKVKYLVGSPAEVLVPGFVYGTMMGHLMKDTPDLTAVAREFYEYYANGSYPSATVSVVESAKLDDLVLASKAILEGVDGEQLVNLRAIQNFRPGNTMFYFDFDQYMEELTQGGELYDAFTEALDNAIIYKANTPRYYSNVNGFNDINHFSGLTVYIPQQSYPYMNREYAKLKWAKAVGTYIPPVEE